MKGDPHLRVRVWSTNMVLADFAAWALYLFAYELCFRGFLLHACLSLGIWPAVAVNVVIAAVYDSVALRRHPEMTTRRLEVLS